MKLALKQEQPLINAALERFTAELPAGTLPVARHVLSAGGKRLRPFLTLMTGRLLGCGDEGLYTLGAAVELLHAATLLHDDILDNALLRRGKPAAHTVYDPTTVVLAGDAMLAKAMLMVSSFGDTRLTDCISEAVMRTAEGEIAEFAQLRDPELSHNDYLSVIIGKTAWMLRASCELGALFAGASPERVKAAATFGLELGIAFQMVDDALDFAGGTGKPRGGDVKEGKATPPLLLYMGALPAGEAASVKERFMRGDFDDVEVEALCDAVCAGQHDQATRAAAGEHLETASAFLALFPSSAERIIMEQMLAYIVTRSH